MDISAYFSKSSTASGNSTDPEDESDVQESDSCNPPKKHCPSAPHRTTTTVRKYNKKWEEEFTWLEFDEDCQGGFCKLCKKRGKTLQRTGGTWITKPLTNWKKAVEKMRAHAKSDVHIHSSQAALEAERAEKEGSIVQRLQQIGEQQKKRNRAAIKALVRCTHFLARQHIPHTTNFDKLVELVVSCGGQDLQAFVENAGKNATYTSKMAVVEFVEALGTWVEESLLERLQQAPFYSIMADESTDVATTEELSIYCCWVEAGVPVEHFLDIVPLKKTDAFSIYTALVDCLKAKHVQLSRIVGMGFDGAATFSGRKSGVQALMKRLSPHALFVHCHCHLLQLACVQAANGIASIKHVYTTLTSLWKFFHYSPKRAVQLKEVQKVLDLPELKIVKPSDTRWLAHERCVKAVKASYSAIVVALDHIYQETHEPEALGISKALCKHSTIAAVYLLGYTLPQVAKLSRALQTEHLDLSVISTLVEATINSLDDALLPAANWVLELLDDCEDLEKATGIKVTLADITSFQGRVGELFINLVKDNISSRFASSKDVVTALSIFDPKKVPNPTSPNMPSYGEESIETLIKHYATDLPAETLEGKMFTKEAIISNDLRAEWKTYRHLLLTQPKDNLKLQLKELLTNDTLKGLLPDLHILASICLSIPVSTASVERSFSEMKLIKNRLRNRMSEHSLSNLMKIALESPDQLSDNDLECIVAIWARKSRRIVV